MGAAAVVGTEVEVVVAGDMQEVAVEVMIETQEAVVEVVAAGEAVDAMGAIVIC